VEVSQCGAVQNLAYTIDDDLMLNLTWEAPEDPMGLIEYQVYKDGELMATTNELTYAFTVEVGTYDVVVKAVFDGCDKDSHLQVCVIGVVENLSYVLEGHNAVVTWDALEGSNQYEVYVNGALSATVDETQYIGGIEQGLTTVTVKPVVDGCYALGASVDVCLIDAVENLQFVSMDEDGMMHFTWDAGENVEYYEVTSNGVVEQTTEPSFAFKGEIGLNDCCVKAHSIYGCDSEPTCLNGIKVCPPVDGFDYIFEGNEVLVTWEGEGIAQNEVVLDGESHIVYENSFSAQVENGVHSLTVTPTYEMECMATFSATFDFEVTNFIPEIRITDVRQGVMATAWTEVEGAIAYNLHRDDELIAEGLTATAYDDTEMQINAEHCYAVQAVFEKGTSNLSNVVCANYYAGVGENGGKLSIFPNPTTDKVNVECVGMTQIDIYSVEGKLVRSLKVEDDAVQIDGLESGIYMLRIMKGDEVIVRKVVKQ
jgi:hypothetical protein